MVSPLQETSLFHSQNIIYVRFKHLACGLVALSLLMADFCGILQRREPIITSS